MKLRYTAVLILLVLSLACNKKQAAPAEEPAATAQIDPATVGTVTGTVKFSGTPPAPQPIDMTQDPGCKSSNVSETYVVNNGELANALVYVKDGLGNYAYPPASEPATVDQAGCRYHPHVLAVRTNQPVKFLNSDPTSHNVHPTPGRDSHNEEWNESQQPKGEPITRQFSSPELMMAIKCNQHPWMKMYVNVSKSPFYAVTGADGKYEIKGLPPGEYTLAFVHEKLGEQTQKVTLAAKDSKTVDQAFKQ